MEKRSLSVVGARAKRCPVTLVCDSMGSIPAIPEAQNVPLLLCHERINEASLPALPGKAIFCDDAAFQIAIQVYSLLSQTVRVFLMV